MSTSSSPVQLRPQEWLRVIWIVNLPIDLMCLIFGTVGVIIGIVLLTGSTPDSLVPLPALDSWPVLLIPICCLIVPGGGFALLMLQSGIASLGSMAYSRLTIHPDGIEVNYWPYYHVFCDWAGMVRDTGFLSVFGGVLIRLEGAQRLPEEHFAALARPLFIRRKRISLSLSTFEGYPDGPLGDALRKNAPHLFP